MIFNLLMHFIHFNVTCLLKHILEDKTTKKKDLISEHNCVSRFA